MTTMIMENNINFFGEDKKDLTAALRRANALFKSFSLLNSSLKLDVVLRTTLESAVSLLNAEMGSLALISDDKKHLVFKESTDPDFDKLKQLKVPIGKGIVGDVAKTGNSVRVEDVSKDERFYGEIDKQMKHTTRSYLCVALIVRGELIGTAQLMNRIDGNPFSQADEDLLNGFARQAALAIQNARLHDMALKKEALDSELRVCNDIQTNLYPASYPVIPGYELYGDSVPCKEVGGDYYTYIERADGTFDAVVADVSGKGVPAAMLVSELHTGFHLLSRMESDILDVIRKLDEHLRTTMIEGKFVTMFAARIEPDSGRLWYVDAGHTPPTIVASDGRTRELDTTGAVIGLPNNVLTMNEEMLHPGELIIAYSDGYSEVMNETGELFGDERIIDLVKSHLDKPLNEIARVIKLAIVEFRQDAPVWDDSTLMMIRRMSGS